MDPKLPTEDPLWAIKAGMAAQGIDYEKKEVILEDGKRSSFLALQAAAENDLAEFGHVKTLDGHEVAVARPKKGKEDHEQLLNAENSAADPNSASNGRFSGGLFGHVDMDGKVHPSTPAQTTPPTRRITSDHEKDDAGLKPRPQWSPVPWQFGDQGVDEWGQPSGEYLFGRRPLDTSLVSNGRRSPANDSTGDGALASPAPAEASTVFTAGTVDRTTMDVDWKPGRWAAWYNYDADGKPCWRPVMVVDTETVRETISVPIRDDEVPIDTGRFYDVTEHTALEPMDVWPEILPRLRSHFETSTSTPTFPAPVEKTDRQWAWLSPSGLGSAVSRALAIPKSAAPHLVGRGGSMIRQMEDILGLIVGIVDGRDGKASVTVFGPRERVDLALPVIQCVSEGGRSILTRLKNRIVV